MITSHFALSHYSIFMQYDDNLEIKKAQVHITVEIIEYVPNSVVIKTILKKSTGNISVMSFDAGEGLWERKIPFDAFVQVIEGVAEMVIDNVTHQVATGQSIVIPAHSPHHLNPVGRFKLVLTIIKSGYEN